MTKICPVCGKEFETYRNSQKYCSKSCNNKDYRKKHQDYYREYQKQYRQNHKDYFKKYYEDHKENLREYQKQYNRDHKDRLKEYRKQYQTIGPKKSRLNYPCYGFHESRVARIPDKLCFNCYAERCRFEND